MTAIALLLAPLTLSACGSSVIAPRGVLGVVGAESQYAALLSEIGGQYVLVSSILNNPTTDPHAYEVSASVARAVSNADLVVQNGLGYDGFMNRLEDASPSTRRVVISVQTLLAKSNSTFNPHLWYDLSGVGRVATAITSKLSQLAPKNTAYFARRNVEFQSSLRNLETNVSQFRRTHSGYSVVATEPVANYLLQAMGIAVLTPKQFMANVMNGVDPAPQDIATVESLLSNHEVQLFVFNQQVSDSVTQGLFTEANNFYVPIVPVDEIMPPRYRTYVEWMTATVNQLEAALANAQVIS